MLSEMIANVNKTNELRLTPDQADTVSRIALRYGGLAISPEKISFLAQRLSRLVLKGGYDDIDSYLRDLSRLRTGEMTQSLIEALTIHTTGFFRESAQFDWLRDEGLPALLEAAIDRERPLAIWSAACSIGAELWTAAIILHQFLKAQGRILPWEVVGSDISRTVLARAERAIYTENEITGLPEAFRRQYLLRARQMRPTGRLYRIDPALRQRARFVWANLVEAPPDIGTLVDVVFLRNVLIYFDPDGRAAAVKNVLSCLQPGGYLLTGPSECLNPAPPGLMQIRPSIYQKV